MKIYSDFAAARTRQIIADVAAIAVIVVAIVIGTAVTAAIRIFAELGVGLERAGADFRSTMSEAADAIGGIPIVGSGVRQPLDRAGEAGSALESFGAGQQAVVELVAVSIGLLVAIVPLIIVARVWLAPRLAFARRAGEAMRVAQTPGGIDLLALRALLTSDPSALLGGAVAPGDEIVTAWRRGDERVLRHLAALGLRDAGIRLA